jgi:hypothetical protein
MGPSPRFDYIRVEFAADVASMPQITKDLTGWLIAGSH